MTFLPIVARELRVISRRRATYWIRSGAASLVIILGTWVFLIMRTERPKELAMALFCVATGSAVLFALLSGPRSTADCISEEKREGTLGLLFLTDLKGYDVVLGKLVAGSINTVYSVVAVLPMLAIPLLMGGGITLWEFGRMALVALNALFFSLTLGICVSSLSRSAQKASAVSSLLVFFFVAGLPACGALVAGATKSQNVNPIFLAPSAGYSYYLAFDSPYKVSSEWFWGSVCFLLGASILCLIVASLIAPRCWQDRPAGRSSRHWRERWQAWKFGSDAERDRFRRRILEINPVYWLLARIRSKPAGIWLFLGFMACGWCVGWWKYGREWLTDGVYVPTALVINLALRYWFAGEATRALAEDRKAGALELLLSTPIKIEEIVRGHWLALKQQFLGPVLAVLAVETLFMVSHARHGVLDYDRTFWYSLWTAGMLMFIADMVALFWIGMWQGLTARNQLRAVSGALGRVLVAPWALYVLCMAVMAVREASQRTSNPDWKFFLGLWFALGIGLDIGFGAWARSKLLKEFRLAAQQLYPSKGDFWKLWFSTLKPHVSGAAPGRLDPEIRG